MEGASLIHDRAGEGYTSRAGRYPLSVEYSCKGIRRGGGGIRFQGNFCVRVYAAGAGVSAFRQIFEQGYMPRAREYTLSLYFAYQGICEEWRGLPLFMIEPVKGIHRGPGGIRFQGIFHVRVYAAGAEVSAFKRFFV